MVQILFLFFALLAIGAAGLIVYLQNSLYGSGLLLIVFYATAGLYLLLDVPFLALVQMFTGTIISFGIYFFATRLQEDGEKKVSGVDFAGRRVSFLIIGLLAILLMGLVLSVQFSLKTPGSFALEIAGGKTAQYIGKLLFGRYVFFLQLIGLLFLVCMVGSCRLTDRIGKSSGDDF
jgi:NADH-quinone oxidoreductase subunit J